MKKLLLILLCFPFVFNSCSTKNKRISYKQLYKEGDKMFYDGESFTGTAYGLYNNEDAKLEFEIQFKEGKINGSAKKWTKGGDIKLEDYFKDGKKNGVQKEWREADGGKRYLYSELNYLDDKLHGKSTYWYYGGEKTCTIENFKFGKKDGIQKRWNSDGTFDYERNYIDGKWIKD